MNFKLVSQPVYVAINVSRAWTDAEVFYTIDGSDPSFDKTLLNYYRCTAIF